MPLMLKSVTVLTVLYSRSCIIGDLVMDKGLIALHTSSRLEFILNTVLVVKHFYKHANKGVWLFF